MGQSEEEGTPCPGCGLRLAAESVCPECGEPNPIQYIDETSHFKPAPPAAESANRVGGGGHVRTVAIGAGLFIAMLIFGFYAGSHALGSLQYRITSVSAFDFDSLSSSVKMDVCNPTPFPATIDGVTTVVYYRGEEHARIVPASEAAAAGVNGSAPPVAPVMVMPYQSKSLDARLGPGAQTDTVSDPTFPLTEAVAGREIAGYNEADFSVAVTTEARILGMTPYSNTHQYSLAEFRNMHSDIQQQQQQGAGAPSCG